MYRSAAGELYARSRWLQLPGGEFPYHHSTYAVPILYQAMVTAQLKWFQKDLGDTLLEYIIGSGKRYLDHFFDSKGIIDWSKANNHDKQGAIWAYSFSVAAESKYAEKALDHLSDLQKSGLVPTEADKSKESDPFYSSWVIWSLVIALKKESRSLTTTPSKMKFRIFCLRSMASSVNLDSPLNILSIDFITSFSMLEH